MTLVVLVDTNVVVSGVLAAVEGSPTARILYAMVAGTLRFILSNDILAEYRAVLLRPAVVARHGLTEAEVDTVLEGIVANAGWRQPAAADEPTLGPAAAEAALPPAPPRPVVPGDEQVIALLETEPQAVLVAGERRLREAVAALRPALTPAELAARLGADAAVY